MELSKYSLYRQGKLVVSRVGRVRVSAATMLILGIYGNSASST